ncbi:lactate/malate family dehydrogenase [Streptomyces sp. JNUCC 64]
MNRRAGAVGIIGAGAVGHTVATLITAAGWCEKLLIASGSARSAEALVTDLEDMAQVIGSPARAETADVSAMSGCDAVVICPRAKFTNTAGRDVRMAGLEANAPLIAALGRQLAGYTGTAIIVTNPVDVMTRLFTRASDAVRVYGVGSATDSARYRLALAGLLAVPVASVEGRVVGEHGDHPVVCAAATRVGGLPAAIPLRDVHAELAARPRRINAGLGRARSGPAGAVLTALTAALGLVDTVVELSVVNPDGSCLGTPLRFTGGRPTVVPSGLDPAETRQRTDADHKTRTAYQTIRHCLEGDATP